MRKISHNCFSGIISTFIFVMMALCFNACQNQKRHEYIYKIDSLNTLAYKYHYISLDSVEQFANKALELEKQCKYSDGKYEALCNKAFANYMRLDYVPAQDTLKLVIEETDNELYKLVADVIMMRISQRRSDNTEYFNYYNDADYRMGRIEDDTLYMTDRQKQIWIFAVSEFHFANSVYTYYTNPNQKKNDERNSKNDFHNGKKELNKHKGIDELEFVKKNMALQDNDTIQQKFDDDLKYVKHHFHLVENDSAQEAMFYYLMGNSRTDDKIRPKENADYLFRAASLAYNSNLKYILAKALSSISEDLAKPYNNYQEEDITYIKHVILGVNDSIDNDKLPLIIADFALNKFQQFGSKFDESQTYIAIANYYIENHLGEQALENMKYALDCINDHHKRVSKDGVVLKAEYDENYKDSIAVEAKWIKNGVVCVPEWIMDVRERLSVVYALLGSKSDCFFNRNVYVDVLKESRQDIKMEQVFTNLKNEQGELNKYMIIALMLLLILLTIAFLLAKKLKHNFIKKYMKEKWAVEDEMKKWRIKTDEDFYSLEEKQEMANAERISKEMRLEEQKKQYINKTTCLAIVYAITPFLDRAVNQVDKLRGDIENIKKGDKTKARMLLINEKLEYINELIQRINLYNDILANWIKIRQGEVALNVEKFDLKPLFEIMGKNAKLFHAKGLNLKIEDTQASVKADRALTLFMMNTLLDNARKYSNEGGTVELYTVEEDEYVDIVVKDSGKGMSQEDVNTITQEKVYDSSKIGNQNDKELKQNKGFGFGLLNCKGIIEKYKKTSELFKVCKFGVESEMGKGSKFFFRLPNARIIRQLCIIAMLSFSSSFAFADNNDTKQVNVEPLEQQILQDSVRLRARYIPDHPYIKKANTFVNWAYDANMEEQWDEALEYLDSVCYWMNQYYQEKKGYEPKYMIKIYDENNNMPDIDLWNSGFNPGYDIILDMRNEAAIAAMAIDDINLYKYNHDIYYRLYKLTTSDATMEQRCEDTRQTINNHRTLFIVLIVIVLLGGIIFSFIYYHQNMVPIFTLRQILELNRRIFNNKDENMIAEIIQQGLNNIRRTEGVVIMIGKDKMVLSNGCPQHDYITPILKDSLEKREKYVLDNGKTRIYPLIAENDNCIGAIAFLLNNVNNGDDEDKLFRMITQYTATNMYFSSVRMEKLNDDIELIEDEKRKTEREGNIVHVQNLVIDNTLSTIKHETMYYPNRIKQIVDNLDKCDNVEDIMKKEEYVNNMFELITYYKEVFTILGDCAAKQIEKPMFKRKNIKLSKLKTVLEKVLNRYNTKNNADIDIKWTNQDKGIIEECEVVADETMIVYLMENVFEAAVNEKLSGSLDCNFDKSENFIKFAFQFDDNHVKKEQLKTMFYPEALKYDMQNDKLIGAQMLLAKQIIREHDEHVRRGCRIYAENVNGDGNGIRITFTIPAVLTKHNISA